MYASHEPSESFVVGRNTGTVVSGGGMARALWLPCGRCMQMPLSGKLPACNYHASYSIQFDALFSDLFSLSEVDCVCFLPPVHGEVGGHS